MRAIVKGRPLQYMYHRQVMLTFMGMARKFMRMTGRFIR